MSSPVRSARRFLAAAQLRFRNARPGSVLILVVALLVLMALIGTAALTTNTIDRYATQQNAVNTEIDLLVEGVKNMAKALIVGDLFDNGKFPPVYRPDAGSPSSTYDHYDMPLAVNPFNDPDTTMGTLQWPTGMDPAIQAQLAVANDAWLSPRYPDLLFPDPNDPAIRPAQAVFNPTVLGFGGNPPVWDAIGAPLEIPNGIPSPGRKLFDSPAVFKVDNTGTVLAASSVPRSYNNRVTDRTPYQITPLGQIVNPIQPDFVTYTVNGVQVSQPAWRFTRSGSTDPGGNGTFLYVAADADGDGIPDSGLRKLPIGQINGLDYYYAARIIDNGSAINVNTAWSRDHEFLGDPNGSYALIGAGGGTQTGTLQISNFFPTSIGVAELLHSYNPNATNLSQLQGLGAGTLTELGEIDRYRFNPAAALPDTMRPSGVITNQLTAAVSGTPPNVYVDQYNSGTPAAARTDFAYNTLGELLYFGLGRRLNNPGVVGQVGGTTDIRFRRYSPAESLGLAYHFVMVNPNASLSTLETQTTNATFPFQPGGTKPTQPSQLDSLFWTAGNELPNTLRNPPAPNTFAMNSSSYPSNFLGLGYWYQDNFNWDSEFGTIAVAGGSLTTEFPLQYKNRRSMFTTDSPVANQLPGAIGSIALAKASVNTAPMADLYAAFLGVMSEFNPDTNQLDTPYSYHAPAPLTGTPKPWQKAPPKPEDMYTYAGMRFTQNVEADATTGTGTNTQGPSEFPVRADTNPQRMFRSTIRDYDSTNTARLGDPLSFYDDVNNQMNPATTTRTNEVQLPSSEMRKLRAALAAVNTESMRKPVLPTASSGKVYKIGAGTLGTSDPIKANLGTATRTPVDVWVYGAEPQPYITEIYINTDTNRAASDYDLFGPGVTNGQPYVAIELFYPYPVAATTAGNHAPYDMTDWVIGLVNRDRQGNAALPAVNVIGQFTAAQNAVFPVPQTPGQFGSYIILENFDPAGTSPVKYRPRSSNLPYQLPIVSATTHDNTTMPPVQVVYVQNLAQVVANGPGTGGELILFKPYFDPTTNTVRNDVPAKPIDSFDFTGLADDNGINRAHTWHYQRKGRRLAAAAGEATGEFWSFMYPGRYDGGLVTRRHHGIQASTWDNTPPAAGGGDGTVIGSRYRDPFQGFNGSTLSPRPTLGVQVGAAVPSDDNASGRATFSVGPPDDTSIVFMTQLMNVDQPGWNAIGSIPRQRFPFGAFARNSDIMQIPYFGAYCILPQNTTVTNPIGGPYIEINALPMDAAFCEDTDTNDNVGGPNVFAPPNNWTYEQLGRFCPLTTAFATAATPPSVEIDDLDVLPAQTYRYFQPDPVINATTTTPNKGWRYRWTTKLFDYLTVQDPQTDYLPNVDPSIFAAVPVSNEGGTPGGYSGPPAQANAENTVPVHGLINVNTASWRVLSSINWTPYPPNDPKRDLFKWGVNADGEYELQQGKDGIDDNIQIAKAIVWWRDGVRGQGPNNTTAAIGMLGPYRSLYDLYRVKALRNYYSLLFSVADPHEPDDADGDFSPSNYDAGVTVANTADGVRDDFEEKFLLLNRASNLLTTRSDSFTVYIVVQGWRNAGSTDPNKLPEKVVERRAAFIADRSGIGPSGGQLKVINVPTE